MNAISWKGVILGALIDVIATNLLSLPIVVYVVLGMDIAHVPQDQLSALVLAKLHANGTLYAASLGIGSLCSILGGYVAARIAKRSPVLNGALSSFLCVCLGLYALVTGSGSQAGPLWFGLAMLPASVALAALGGYVVQRTRRAAPELVRTTTAP